MEIFKTNEIQNISTQSMLNILNGIDSLIYVTEPSSGKILFMNDSMKHHYNIKGDCTGKLCYKVLQKNLEHRCDFCPCFQLDKEPEKAIVWEEHSTLTNRIYRNTDRYIDWYNGKIVHIQHSIDTTELVAAKEYAEQTSRYKSAFLANMSHEIRTPMNAILGIAEIQLQNKHLPKDTEDALNKIYESGDLLLNIINDILDLSKIEADKLELVPVKYDIASLLYDTAQLIRLRNESKPIIFNLHITEDTPLELFGDELRIKQVLNNILSNAFKYTDEGEVKLSVHSESADDTENTTIVFRVSDTGQGMSKVQLDKLFDEYTRFNIEANRAKGGAGLGMSITKRLVNLMKGDISAESEPGKGSIFTVRLPQKRIDNTECGAELAGKLKNLSFKSTTIRKKIKFKREYMPYGSVLVVDDVESNIYVARGMLLPYGLNIDTAASGFEAIEKVKNGNVYDIIFMDHMMPKMDGIEAVKIIRDMGYKNNIVALTANALIGREEMFLRNGFDAFISKPVDSRELNFLLIDLIRNTKPPEIIEAARIEQENAGKNIKTDLKSSKRDLEKIFTRDAENALKILTELNKKLCDHINEGINSYINTVHGMKSALANIGEIELSNIARILETAGKERDLSVIVDETSMLINALTALIKKFKPRNDKKDIEISEQDNEFLREKLIDIRSACVVINKKAAKAALNELKQKTWPNHVNNILDSLSTNLLHSEFQNAEEIIDHFIM
ncbi:MAG: ATP-binding protein [Treponema sp.]|nr:ATP-binding protein [Treponema sp.]